MRDWRSSLHHDGSRVYVQYDHCRIGATVRLRLRASLEAPLQRVYIRTCPDGEQELLEMKRAVDTEASQWWEGELRLGMPLVNYRFYLLTPDSSLWLTAMGVQEHSPTDQTDFKLIAREDTTAWVRRMVFYQIFPDRFSDGDPSNNVRDGEYLYGAKPVVRRSWGELPQQQTGEVEFYGGDLQGIAAKLDHLERLGANGVYLTPVFTAPSNHKYDTADYFNVDPHLGGNSALARLRAALDEREMRLLLDVVLNHCGNQNSWFLEAQADPLSPAAEYFTFQSHPEEYACWMGIRTLPKLNYRSERLRMAVYGGQDALLRKWLRAPYRIDGWRIDVANMLARQGESQLGHKIGRGIRRAVKEEFPEAYLLGEHFHDGTAHLQGNELDASMNYRGFTFPLLKWLTGFDIDMKVAGEWMKGSFLSTEALAAQWRAFIAAVPWQTASQQFNLLGSHDTPRVLTLLGGDLDGMELAVTLLFTFPGVPCVYYGDEIGLEGGRDPDNRRCMVWNEESWNHRVYDCYRRMARLRRRSQALCEGGFQMLLAERETLAFLRESENERILVVARRASDSASLDLASAGCANGTLWREYFTGREVRVEGGRMDLSGFKGAEVWRELRGN